MECTYMIERTTKGFARYMTKYIAKVEPSLSYTRRKKILSHCSIFNNETAGIVKTQPKQQQDQMVFKLSASQHKGDRTATNPFNECSIFCIHDTSSLISKHT